MKAKVIGQHPRGNTTVNGVPVAVGDTVFVDESTFRNLVKKGILEAADSESKKVDLEEPSTLSRQEAKKAAATEAKSRKERNKKAAERAKAQAEESDD